MAATSYGLHAILFYGFFPRVVSFRSNPFIAKDTKVWHFKRSIYEKEDVSIILYRFSANLH